MADGTKTATRRGIMFVSKGKAEFIEEPMVACDTESMLLQTLYSGLSNGTERNVLLGGNYGGSWPSRCGYQCVSRVIEVGARISGFHAGDIVYTGTFPGHVPYHTARETDLIIKLPGDIDLRHAALFGVATVPIHDIRRANISIDDQVLVVGAGVVGQFAAQAARVVGANVTVVDLDDARLALARELGADTIINIGTAAGQAQLQANKPYSTVIECSGGDVLDMLIGGKSGAGVIGYRARVLIIAGRQDVCYNFNAGQNTEIAVLQAGHFTQIDLEHVLRLMRKGAIRIQPLLKDLVPIAEAIRIYDQLRDQPNTLLGTVFQW